MHLVLCVAGTVLAMVGHVPHRTRLWVPHVVGLAAMVTVSLGVAGERGRWIGVVVVAACALASVLGLHERREHLEAGIDAAATSALIAVLPAMHGASHHQPMTGTAMGGGPVGVAVVATTVVLWATARAAVAGRTSETPGLTAGTWRVNAAGSMAMLAGMTMMIV